MVVASCGRSPLSMAVLFTPPLIPTGLQDSSRTPVGLQDSYWSPIGFVRSPMGMTKSNRSPVRIPESYWSPTIFASNWILPKFEGNTSDCIHTN